MDLQAIEATESDFMPLLDHFRPPIFNKGSWEGFHGGWPMTSANAEGSATALWAASPFCFRVPFLFPRPLSVSVPFLFSCMMEIEL